MYTVHYSRLYIVFYPSCNPYYKLLYTILTPCCTPYFTSHCMPNFTPHCTLYYTLERNWCYLRCSLGWDWLRVFACVEYANGVEGKNIYVCYVRERLPVLRFENICQCWWWEYFQVFRLRMSDGGHEPLCLRVTLPDSSLDLWEETKQALSHYTIAWFKAVLLFHRCSIIRRYIKKKNGTS